MALLPSAHPCLSTEESLTCILAQKATKEGVKLGTPKSMNKQNLKLSNSGMLKMIILRQNYRGFP